MDAPLANLLPAVFHFSKIQATQLVLLLGIILFIGAIGGWLFQKLKIPQVVGYIVMGILIGSSGFHILEPNVISALDPISTVALSLIGFLIGGELKLNVIKKYGKQFISILLFEAITPALVVGGIVTLVVWLFTKDIAHAVSLGLILGAICSATAPAATTDVLAEYRTRGPLTTTVYGIVAMDDAVALILYTIASTIVTPLIGGSALAEGHQVRQVKALELFPIELVVTLFPADKLGEFLHLGDAQGRLEIGHPVIVPDLIVYVIVGIGFGLGGQKTDVVDSFRPRGSDRAASAGGDDLVAVEAEASEVADGPGIPAGISALCVGGPQGLGGVLDHLQAEAARSLHDGFHVGHVAEDMDDHDGSDFPALVAQDPSFKGAAGLAEGPELVRIHAEAVVAVDKDRNSKLVFDGIDGRDKGEGRNQDYVSRPDPGLHHGQMQRGGSALAGGHVVSVEVAGQFLFQSGNVGTPCGDPALIECVVDIFSFISLKIGDGERYKSSHSSHFLSSVSHICITSGSHLSHILLSSDFPVSICSKLGR